jgi:hypothetical protein
VFAFGFPFRVVRAFRGELVLVIVSDVSQFGVFPFSLGMSPLESVFVTPYH